MSTLFSDHPEPTIRSGCVRVRFLWVEDRWTHRVEWLDGESWKFLAEPIHSDADPNRVVSPTYQEVHLQPAALGSQILAIGRWGKHHLSAVFSIEARENDTILAVDVADRCRVPFEALGCSYRVVLEPSRLVDASPSRAVWEVAADRWSVETDSPDRIAIAELGRIGMSVQVQAAIDPKSFTHRCRYRWVFSRRPLN